MDGAAWVARSTRIRQKRRDTHLPKARLQRVKGAQQYQTIWVLLFPSRNAPQGPTTLAAASVVSSASTFHESGIGCACRRGAGRFIIRDMSGCVTSPPGTSTKYMRTKRRCRNRDFMQGAAMAAVVLLLASAPCSAPRAPWQAYGFRNGTWQLLPLFRPNLDVACSKPREDLSGSTVETQRAQEEGWHVTASILADVTGDAQAERTMVVWRRWSDWPIQQWTGAPSPIKAWHDAAGDSCHLIVLDARDGRQVWAGSALPAPLVGLEAGDVDGDGHDELVTLEGDYATGRNGPANHIDIWGWNGFGFTLEWRSPPGAMHQLCLTDVDGDSILEIACR
jgi:hypothetical protein